jgi:hypothetical protein
VNAYFRLKLPAQCLLFQALLRGLPSGAGEFAVTNAGISQAISGENRHWL